jgi:hypothetical protein
MDGYELISLIFNHFPQFSEGLVTSLVEYHGRDSINWMDSDVLGSIKD